MHIRKFYANNLPAAMRDIRKALGADAVILSTRYLTTEDEAVVVDGGRAKVEVTAVREHPSEPNRVRPVAKRSLPSRRKAPRAVQPQIPECLPAEGSLRTDLLRSASEALAARTGGGGARKKPLKRKMDKTAEYVEPAPKWAPPSALPEKVEPSEKRVAPGRVPEHVAEKSEPLENILRELNDLRNRLDSMEVVSPQGSGFPEAVESAQASAARRMVAKPATDSLAPRSVDGLFPEPDIGSLVLPKMDAASAVATLVLPEMEEVAVAPVVVEPVAVAPVVVPPEAVAPLAKPTKTKGSQAKVKASQEPLTYNRDTILRAASVTSAAVAKPVVARAAPAEVPVELSHCRPAESLKPVAKKVSKPAPARRDAPAKASLPLPLLKFQEHLHKQGVNATLSRRILDRMRFTSRSEAAAGGPKGRSEGSDKSLLSDARGTFKLFVEAVRDFVPRQKTNAVSGKVRIGSRVMRKGGENLPHKIALVGPTGVGKTTTIAKIASHYALEKNLKVALVTLDTYRIGAVEQLRTYAKLLGVPLEVVADPAKLRYALDHFSNADLILIDTPGHGPGDDTALDRLSATLGGYEDLEVHLVLTASLRMEETYRIMKSFEPMGYDRVVFSKLDEARRLGEILNTWIMGGFDVSYFTTGQRVPEDLERATVDSLCKGLVVR